MKARNRVKALVIALTVAAGALALTACSNTITKASQCAYVIAHNYFDTAHIRKIVYPGQRFNSSNSTAYYVPCNNRNYVVTNPNANTGDLKTPVQAKTDTGKDSSGESIPGTPIDVQLSAFFTLNESKSALTEFLPFCQKYNCFSGNYTNNAGTHFSSPGWNGMLEENFQPAVKRAVQHAMLKFPPDIWNDTSKWPEVGDAISDDLKTQLSLQTGSSLPFFCGYGSNQTKCPPIRVSIEQIDPTDAGIRNIYDQEVQQGQQQQLAAAAKKTNQAELEAAKAKYGDDASQILGNLDQINACKASGGTCVVQLGGNSGGGVSVSTK